MDQILDKKNAHGTNGIDNNTDSESVYIKAGFSIDNIIGTNADVSVGIVQMQMQMRIRVQIEIQIQM